MESKQTPLITIITATYNSGSVIEKSILSVIDQTYKNIEYIIIDGNSTDGTVGIIEKYDKYITKWISEPDKGVYDAWNKALKLSSGNWITFIGSDDVFYPSALADYVDFINTYSEADLEFISSKMHLVTMTGKIIKPLGLPWIWKKARLENTIAHPGALHSRVLFEKYGHFDTDFRICGDYELLLRPGKDFKTAFMHKFTVRMAQGGLSGNSKKLFKEHYRAVTTTGKLDINTARFYYVFQMLKHYVKFGLRSLGKDI
ncbi:glycosyltransferase family 2 protein [Mucilaginibacter gossypii]|uniref:glycosyltransferase family 2 protein n=1 Tax=Mucilaginibacter gossypii TaxID=551996 RepID=UPI000DCF0962|nr:MULTISPECIES: glycosyltransferase family 2 protein [Mucilaginibacter]QTE39016.1 glycosyltransferase family 2 protein [Mucilaginibacter gossypii]RAV53440.1 glycosyltransferase [Mucilaginibacter rubeus]